MNNQDQEVVEHLKQRIANEMSYGQALVILHQFIEEAAIKELASMTDEQKQEVLAQILV